MPAPARACACPCVRARVGVRPSPGPAPTVATRPPPTRRGKARPARREAARRRRWPESPVGRGSSHRVAEPVSMPESNDRLSFDTGSPRVSLSESPIFLLLGADKRINQASERAVCLVPGRQGTQKVAVCQPPLTLGRMEDGRRVMSLPQTANGFPLFVAASSLRFFCPARCEQTKAELVLRISYRSTVLAVDSLEAC